MRRVFFVTGTDTGVGKTFISCAFLECAKRQGFSALGLKPVAAGAQNTEQGLRNGDALALLHASSIKLDYRQINPLCLEAATAPHLAAAAQKIRISLERLTGLVRGSLMMNAQVTLIEGAGGWRVPLNESEYLSALPLGLNIPIILVVGVRLGCINHALLTAEAIRRDGLSLAGWVANHLEPQLSHAEGIIQSLTQRIHAPCLGQVPYLAAEDYICAADYLSLPVS